jgi:hypothetical protein
MSYRTKQRIRILAGTLLLALPAIAAEIPAAPIRSLPDFDVTAIDGSVTHTSQIVRSGKWLLVFVRPNCSPCTSLLSALDAAPTQDGARVAVIVKATTTNGLASLKAQYPHIPNAAWYADVHLKAASSLMVPASPTTLGMRQGTIAWRLTGAVSSLPTGELNQAVAQKTPDGKPIDPLTRQRAIVNGWLKQP